MEDWARYFPILKGKAGEFRALRTLPKPVRRAITPLIEVPNIPWDFEREEPKTTLEKHLSGVLQRLMSSWDPDHPVFFDLMWLPPADRMEDGSHPLTFIMGATEAAGMCALPVTGTERDDGYQRAVREWVRRGKRGVCVRLQGDVIPHRDDRGDRLVHLMGALGVGPEEVDLILDLSAILPGQECVLAVSAREAVNTAAGWGKWRSLVVAGSGFPVDLRAFRPGEVGSIPRSEWRMWTRLSHMNQLTRRPAFGDYGISHPRPAEIDPKVMQMSANLRYTTEEAWLIFRGRNVKSHGYAQSHDLSRQLTARPEFRGRQFSPGDEFFQKCSTKEVGPGNAMTWRFAGTSHHLVSVADQLANFA